MLYYYSADMASWWPFIAKYKEGSDECVLFKETHANIKRWGWLDWARSILLWYSLHSSQEVKKRHDYKLEYQRVMNKFDN